MTYEIIFDSTRGQCALACSNSADVTKILLNGQEMTVPGSFPGMPIRAIFTRVAATDDRTRTLQSHDRPAPS
ncbi:hypothetical protein YTPLAS18_32440 [Nitrospira sp.]|nr:hypothetical protein YTPLAS18_32440 [Nitrospira sp.]